VFAVFNYFVLGHMLEVVFQPFVSCPVRCSVLFYCIHFYCFICSE